MTNTPIAKRIADKIFLDTKKGCWLWEGALTNDGYGSVNIKGKTRRVHRVVYESFKGFIPKDLELDHICRIKHCCNPQHLEAVTHIENIYRRKKTRCKRGHSYEEVGYYLTQNGGRDCRRCIYERKRKNESKRSKTE